jgi:hypothetical protein
MRSNPSPRAHPIGNRKTKTMVPMETVIDELNDSIKFHSFRSVFPATVFDG